MPERIIYKFGFIIFFLALVRSLAFAALVVPAFPGAQGGGAESVGGRGGKVILVTNLNDSGSGSLRACVTALGPRTCVFRVGGTIRLLSALYFSNPYLTVAGQTAPGDGIMIIGPDNKEHMIAFAAHDVIWRYTRVAKGFNQTVQNIYRANGDSPGSNIVMWDGSYNVMIDHNSTWWNQDEGIGAWRGTNNPLKNITISYNIMAEGLAGHSTGTLIGGSGAAEITNIDLHHNLTMNNNHRNPSVAAATMRHVNNITYNNQWRLVQLQSEGLKIQNDFIGNIYKKGPLNSHANSSNPHEFLVNGEQLLYLSLNKGFTQPNPTGDQWIMAYQGGGSNGPEIGPIPVAWRRTTPLANTLYPIIAEPVATLEESMLPVVGASRRLACDGSWIENRNSVDKRLINQYKTNTGIAEQVTNESDVGGFPITNGGTPCADSDDDGMPDVWETARGLNPNLYADTNQDRNGDGYTNLEEYLNGASSDNSNTVILRPRAPTGLVIK